MFLNKKNPDVLPELKDKKPEAPPEKKDVSPEAMRELLEKNLKWSQIIYEQNRRLNGKLAWSAASDWVRLLILLIPLVLAVIYLPPLIQKLSGDYNQIVKGSKPGEISPVISSKICDFLSLDQAKCEQLKALVQ